jgi:hypothetical protein
MLYSLVGSLIPCAIVLIILHKRIANNMKEFRNDISLLLEEVKKFHASIEKFEAKIKKSQKEKIHVRRKI